MKKITIIWTVTLLVVVTGLTIFGLKIKKDNVGNFSEDALVEQTKKYLGTYPALYPTKGNELRLSGEKLKDEGYNPELEKDCVGYVIIKNTDMGFKYEPYVKCPDYITKGYSNE